MFDKLKKKLHHHKKKSHAADAPELPKAADAKASSPGLEEEKKLPTRKAANPSHADPQPAPQPNAFAKDLWWDALQKLPAAKQTQLKSMGFGKIGSGESVETGIDDLVEAVNKKQEECEKKFWRVSVGDNDIVLRNYTTKIVGWVQKAGDIAIQFAPPQASMPWSVIKSLMQVPVIEGEQMAALLGATEKIVRIVSRGQVYEQVYLSNVPGSPEDKLSKGLQDALLRIYTTSLELLADSGGLFSKNTAHRTLDAILNPGNVSSGLSALAQQEDELLRDVQACETRRSAAADDRMIGMLDAMNAPLTRVDKNVQTLLEGMEKEGRIALLEWISSVPFGDHHGNVKEGRTPGTGEWLLQDSNFCSWEEASSSGIFWLQGSPGTGKTYLTSRVIDLYQSMLSDPPKDEGFAFFYCNRNEEDRGKALSVFRSYVRQLSTTPASPESIQTELKEVCSKARESGSKLSFETCKELIAESLKVYPKTTLVIDALDECEPESRDIIIDALNTLVSETNNTVKIFISSRPDPDIQALLVGSTSVAIQASHNQADIQKFLEIQLDNLARKTAFIGRMKAKIIAKLLEGCQGMFQWASLQVHQIFRCRTESSAWKRLENLPEDLQKAYDEIWNEIEALEEPDKTLTKRALTWVMAAHKPMKTNMLLSAIRVGSKDDEEFLADEIDEQGLLSLCNNFLVIDSKMGVWRFSHASVIEYLESRHSWTLSQAHCHAATACLSFFINVYEDDLETVPNEELQDFWRSEESIPDGKFDIIDIRNPFHIYIRHYWVVHVHGSGCSEESTVASLLKTFLGAPDDSSVQYRTWYRQVRLDASMKPLLDNSTGWDISGFDSNTFNYYRTLRELLYIKIGYIWGSELEPEDAAVFAMCRFAFDKILWGWWQNRDINISRLNQRGHDLLTVAAIGGSVPICQHLIAKGVDVNFRIAAEEDNIDYGSALVAAAHKGRTAAVRCLVESGADVNMSYSYGQGRFRNALVAAVDGGHLETVKYLVQTAKADPNMPPEDTDYLGSALGRAIVLKNHEMVNCLVDAGADLSKPLGRIDYYSALEAAAHKGQLKTVKYLVQEGADVNMVSQPCSLEGCFHHGTAIEAAAHAGKIDVVRYLAQEAHAEVNVAHSYGHGSPLVAALAGDRSRWDGDDGADEDGVDYLATVRSLIHEAGADVNLPLRCGENGSALAAADEIHEVKLLLEAGADVNMPLTLGKYGSALAATVATSRDPEILEALLEAGANVNMPLRGGEYGSALAAASAENQTEAVKVLLQAGADANMQIPYGSYGSALTAASAKDNTEVVEILLEAGADVNMQVSVGEYGTALIAAASGYAATETVKCLVKSGANVNALPAIGNYGSALAAATAHDIAKCLLEAGADVNAHLSRGDYGSALAAAASRNLSDIVRTLMDAGADANMPLQSGKYTNAFEAAIDGWDLDILKAFIDAKADVNQPLKKQDYGNAITKAAMSEYDIEKLEFLIEAGADVNQTHPEAKYVTALIAAAFFGLKDSAKRLIEAGADVNIRLDKAHLPTALQAAQSAVTEEEIEKFKTYCSTDERVTEEVKALENGRAEVAELLRQHGATS
ncbi:Pfs, NACHT and Ankyrin domain protein [Aspergillus niger]|uniref:Pfs, NACHT and Ankyrin domain protein n=2 Tax=Aspergillus subgen. Circumdati TaxID=2720871 RepID=A0A117DZG2_ASPNG|nr:Pfs, NACHT and Ankyrin domain protein [Aspergillus niger]